MIYLECSADEVLVRTLGCAAQEVRHCRGKGQVLNRLRRSPDAKGMVDEDPWSVPPRELEGYEPVEELEGIVLMRRKGEESARLAIVRPYLEEWIYRRAAAGNLKPETSPFNLPDSASGLHAVPRYETWPGFVEFLRALCDRDFELRRLGDWLAGR